MKTHEGETEKTKANFDPMLSPESVHDNAHESVHECRFPLSWVDSHGHFYSARGNFDGGHKNVHESNAIWSSFT